MLDLSGFESTILPPPVKTHQLCWWRSAGGRWIRWPAFRGKAVRRKPVFALVLPTCHWHVGLKWVRIHDSSLTNKNPPAMLVGFYWWGKVDSNHRSYKQQIYSLSPLATREFPHMKLASQTGLGYHIIFWKNVKKKIRNSSKNLRAFGPEAWGEITVPRPSWR